ncbi:hypothetical protein PROFUN_05164 [Planoprotostelium fungivorum]|uniref:Uncharacterized protein n=1 Tax=Planoprotostelium fungivorum TaxID=1890364 RepID=A0A2P6NRU9_9EUKA|nr:hypothetical protein PROFUN_05164 [Planoprotostelium fungivorum]
MEQAGYAIPTEVDIQFIADIGSLQISGNRSSSSDFINIIIRATRFLTSHVLLYGIARSLSIMCIPNAATFDVAHRTLIQGEPIAHQTGASVAVNSSRGQDTKGYNRVITSTLDHREAPIVYNTQES